MTESSFERAKRIFHEALEREPASRSSYLDGACGGDTHLRGQVDGLLSAHEEAGEFMSRPGGLFGGTREGPGTRVGQYRLIEAIGEGGFGTVYRAEQVEPVKREVALKILKLGMDTKEVIARFEAERQALARMDHPNIAKVFDAGATESGRPYFVMELVRGVPVTDYCDARNLTTRERLELFVPVCQAVEHAHKKGVIHRDLKPTNVLVTEVDDRAVPMVIDFGIAKATDRPLTEKTLLTAFQQLLGTPAYMSPEQAGGGGVEIDARTDVYSLGVLLYELLTSRTPIDAGDFGDAAWDDVRRLLIERNVPTPSRRLATLGRELDDVARRRRAAPSPLCRELRGDLDWIVMKAMEKERGRRYASAKDLAADLGHFLADEPVTARRPSRTYRAWKFMKRHRAAATIVLLLLGGLAVAVLIARAQAVAARFALSEAHRSEAVAQYEAERTASVSRFLSQLLAESDPTRSGPVSVPSLLGAAEQRISSGEFSDRPEIEARVRATLAKSYARLGRHGDAAAQFASAVDLYTNALGENHDDTLSARLELARELRLCGRLEDARKEATAVRAARRAALGEADEKTMEAAALLAEIAAEKDGE